MELQRTEPNEHGVFSDCAVLSILVDKKLKCSLEIRVACGPDGKFYSGYSHKIGTGGQGGGPSITGKTFDTYAAAVMFEIDHLRKIISHNIDIKQTAPTNEKKLLEAVNKFAEPYAAEAKRSAPIAVEPSPAKTAYVFGWKYGGAYHQYIQLRDKNTPAEDVPAGYNRCDWWPLHKPDKATRFKNIEAVLKCFRKINPGNECAEARIYNGFLNIFEDGPAGIRQIPRLTRQESLFDNPPPFQEQQIDLLQGNSASKTYSADELKVLQAGFALVRYDRDNKTVQCTREDYLHGWAPPIPFITYVAAEKTLRGMLNADNVVEVHASGTINYSTSYKKLLSAGFDFYRSEGIISGHGYPRIKISSKNWGTWEKYKTDKECQTAWDELMKDPKALVG